MDDIMQAVGVSKILGGKGKKLHAREVHVRRTAEKGKYIAVHKLTDKHGNPPTDGQRGEAEYPLSSPEEMIAHLQQHMGSEPQDDEIES